MRDEVIRSSRELMTPGGKKVNQNERVNQNRKSRHFDKDLPESKSCDVQRY